MMRRIVGIGVAVSLLSISLAQDVWAGDLSTPKGAVTTYFKAMRAGDASTANAAAVVSKEDEALTDAGAAESRAKASLIAAATKRWGAEKTARKIGWGYDMLVMIVEKASVKMDGDRAVIGEGGDFVCRRINNQWRFDRSARPRSEPISASIERCKKAEEVYQRLAEEIDAGRWNSLDDVLKERDAHMLPPPPPPGVLDTPASQPADAAH